MYMWDDFAIIYHTWAKPDQEPPSNRIFAVWVGVHIILTENLLHT